MLFTIGTKVKFLHTGDEGVIRSRLDNGMVSVYIPSTDMEIPASPEDLIRKEDKSGTSVKAKVVEGKKEVKTPAPPPVNIVTQYAILKSYGIQLAFLPVENDQGLTDRYKLYLLNDTRYDVVYNIKLLLNYKTDSWNGKLPAVSAVEFGSMLYDDLNEAPEFEITINWVTTEGLSEPAFKDLRIKAKSFFKSLRTAPLLNKPTHLYRLFEKPVKKEKQSDEDLQTYTRRHAKPTWYKGRNTDAVQSYSSDELAHFEREIDLHIEKLADNWQKLGNAEILAIQLSRFETYLEKALRMGVPSVFVIHGVGKGKLRDEIATRLMQNPDVDTFRNDYHPKYGYGATEVIFVKD